MKKILLHTCCAPCTTKVNLDLVENGFDVTGFFYNPNIYPLEEYEMRRKCMEYYSAISNLPMYYIENDLEHEAGNCVFCYEMRLYKAAQFAKSNGFDSFSTTLLISPFQKHDVIKKIGLKTQEMLSIPFHYKDFRPHYYEGRALAQRYNLYRQKYCGCDVSLAQKEEKDEQVA